MNAKSLSILFALLALAGCHERTWKIAAPASAHLNIVEGRTSGPGLMPDLVSVYVSPSDAPNKISRVAIFQGQDIGKICYQWIDPATIELAISDGYADRVSTEVQLKGKILRVKYVGVSPNCHWRRGDPA